MVFNYITDLEKKIIKDFARNLRSLKALNRIKSLLYNVDHEAEEIPVTTEEKLIELLHSLKEQPLTSAEKEIASGIISVKNKRHG